MREFMKSTIEEVKKKYPSAEVSYGKPSREETESRLAARKKEQEEAAHESARKDFSNLPALEKDYGERKAKFEKLGGSKYQYADKEQNLSEEEREARGMHASMRQLEGRIHAAKKSQGMKHGGKISLKDCSVSTHDKNPKHKHCW